MRIEVAIMKIAMIHGQNHRGSTYHIGAMLAEKLGGEVTEFFLPRDFGEFCVGCNSCSHNSSPCLSHGDTPSLIPKDISSISASYMGVWFRFEYHP